MKIPKKILKKVRGKYNKRPSITKLAEEYYSEAFTDRHKRRLFREEMEHKFGHHLTLKKLLARRGHGRCKPLTPSMIDMIEERIGDR